MAITKFGEYMRILRIKKNLLMKDTANVLGVKSSFLSAVETGKKKIPDDWYQKLIKIYSLNNDEAGELKRAIAESSDQIKIDTACLKSYQKNLVVELSTRVTDVDEKTSIKIMKLLQGGK